MKKKQPSLTERLLAKLLKLGVSRRNAPKLAKDLTPTASKAPVKGTVTQKLETRLFKLGLSEKKSAELAKGLAPMVRASIKSKVKVKKITLDDVDDSMVEETVSEITDSAEDAELDKVAPRVNGHRLRLDLPVVSVHGQKGIEMLRVMNGLTTNRSYLVASVKSESGILAVRKMDERQYKVKFYPTMAYWSKTKEELYSLGMTDFLHRSNLYERVFATPEQLDQLLRRLEAEAAPKSRMKQLVDRYLTIKLAPLLKAFKYLHGEKVKAA